MHTRTRPSVTDALPAHLQQPRQRMQALLLPFMVGARFGGRRGDADDVRRGPAALAFHRVRVDAAQRTAAAVTSAAIGGGGGCDGRRWPTTG
jgi:hypothetical protein